MLGGCWKSTKVADRDVDKKREIPPTRRLAIPIVYRLCESESNGSPAERSTHVLHDLGVVRICKREGEC